MRGAATLKARLQKGLGATTIPPIEEKCGEAKEAGILTALDCFFRGGELLKRTRKGMSADMFATTASLKLKNKRRRNSKCIKQFTLLMQVTMRF